jgi:NADP-dependent 3-hydroxy acid dehydrogenase YdfG
VGVGLTDHSTDRHARSSRKVICNQQLSLHAHLRTGAQERRWSRGLACRRAGQLLELVLADGQGAVLKQRPASSHLLRSSARFGRPRDCWRLGGATLPHDLPSTGDRPAQPMPRTPVALVTGGGRGIGKATAQRLHQHGYAVAIADLDQKSAESVAVDLGTRAIGLRLDVADRGSFEQCVRETELALGPITVLINNAGIMPLHKLTEETDDIARHVLDVNCHGVLHGMKVALPRMLTRGRGHIINVASVAGTSGLPGAATYCGSKSFVITVSDAVRLELRGTGVSVSCVLPGIVNTELAAGLHGIKGIPTAEPADVAEAIVNLIRTRRRAAFVPAVYAPVSRLVNMLPARAKDKLSQLLGGSEFMLEADRVSRSDYERRVEATATASEPAPVENLP